MGGSSSKESKTPELPKTDKSKFLTYKRCIFLTQEQYKNKEFLPDNMYSIVGYDSNVDNFVLNTIKNLSNNGQRKIPAPIYVMYAKKLEKKGTIFGSCIEESLRYAEQENIANQRRAEAAKRFEDKVNANNNNPKIIFYTKLLNNLNYLKTYMNDITNINNDLANFLKSLPCLNDPANKDKIEQYKFMASQLGDENTLNSTNFSIFEFGSNYEIYIFIPNLNKSNRFLSNLYLYSLTNQWIIDFISNKYYYNIISLFDVEGFINKKIRKFTNNQGIINAIRNLLNRLYVDINPFIRESNNSCYDNGCVSEYGEDFISILPGSYKDEDAIDKKAPFFPTKCLKRYNYKGHMFDPDTAYYNRLKEKLLGDCYNDFKSNYDQIASGSSTFEKDSSFNLLDQLNKCAQDFKYEDKGKNPGDYSKTYNKNIMIELAKRNSSHPGIQENSLPVFEVNPNEPSINPYITYMPWGNILIGKDYVMNVEDDPPLYEGSYISSFDGQFKLTVLRNGFVFILKNENPYNILNRNDYSGVYNKHLILENGYLVLKGYTKPKDFTNNSNNGAELIQLWRILAIDAEKANNPYSLIIDNSGNIVIYDNGFNNANSKELTDANNNVNNDLSNFNMDDYLNSLFDNYFSSIENKETLKDDFYSKDNEDKLTNKEIELFKSRHPELSEEHYNKLREDPELFKSLSSGNYNKEFYSKKIEEDKKTAYIYADDLLIRLKLIDTFYNDIKNI